MLGMLYDPMRLSRIQENETRTTGKQLTVSDYMEELYEAVWSELGSGSKIGPYRRILQREFLTRVTEFLLKPAAPTPDDVVAISRFQLKQLEKNLNTYQADNPNTDLVTKAHLENCADVINEVLKAVYVKNGKGPR